MLSAVLVTQLDGDFAGPVLAQVASCSTRPTASASSCRAGHGCSGQRRRSGTQDQSRLREVTDAGWLIGRHGIGLSTSTSSGGAGAVLQRSPA